MTIVKQPFTAILLVPDTRMNNNMKKTALITGVTGQDGSFLAEFLIEKGYDVHGTIVCGLSRAYRPP